MKKSLLIGTIVVALVLAIAGSAIAYASWDKTKDSLDITANSVAQNVNVEAKAVANSADTTKNLVPSIATIRTSKDVEDLKAGAFTVELKSDAAGYKFGDLVAKVNATYKITSITLSDGTAITHNSNDWKRYVQASVSATDAKGTYGETGNLVLSTTNAQTTFYVYISFKDFGAFNDTAEQNYIKSLSGKVFKVNIEVNIASKTPAV